MGLDETGPRCLWDEVKEEEYDDDHKFSGCDNL